MISKKFQGNENIKPNSFEIKRLREIFPQYFNNKGEFDLNRFTEFLKLEEVDISKEGYELKFLGKSYAKYLSSLETETYISPEVNHNSREENKKSENLYIVGDNIDALKHLLSSYTGKIKCIYIDPPYNTGTDGFVYPDNFQFNVEELSQKIGITEEEAQRILDLGGKSTHSAWLTFMYPRLVIARDLLKESGIIFISIDDNENSNLKLICDEIYGEENFLTCITRSTGTPTGGGFDGLVNELDYILVYAKNVGKTIIQGLPMDELSAQKYNQEDDKGRYLTRSLRRTGGEDRREDRPTMYYSLISPEGTEIYPIGPTGYESRWICAKETAEELEKKGLLEWKITTINGEKTWHPYQKYYLENRTKKPGNIWKDLCYSEEGIDLFLWEDVEGNKKATREVKRLFNDTKVFDSPKSVSLLKKILKISTSKDDYVLDFFSGSATTAEACMRLNYEDNYNLKYIMVQIPQNIPETKDAYKLGYKTLDEVGRARIEKAANKIKIETNADIDYGYKLYHLKTPEGKTLIELENFEPELKLITDDMISIFDNQHALGKESILATWLNEDGYGLTKSSNPYKLKHYSADLIEKSLYIINEGIEDEDVMCLIKRIENEDLEITRVVVYVHSVRFSILHELRKNLKVLRNNKNVTLIERY